MDREQEELQFLGFFGILNESFAILSSRRKIFGQIALSTILPLSFVFLAHIQISELLFGHILHDEYALDRTQVGTPNYQKLSDMLSSEWLTFWLFKLVYFIFSLILSLLSTSAVVYTIACVYTAKEISFKKVMSVVPRVWKRLMLTFLWNFIIVFIYNVGFALVLIFWVFLIGPSTFGILVGVVVLFLYFLGFVYISLIWRLASVVSVLEDAYGIEAMIKSKDLIKGKMTVAFAIFMLLGLCFWGIQMAYEKNVVFGDWVWNRIVFGIICFNLLVILILLGLTIDTVIYFVCKSYHHENIDKSALADHLEVYLGDYVPLKSKDVQLEQFAV
ncbi:hypothetical protein NMG60_11007016 [Bertholletia excelsa]